VPGDRAGRDAPGLPLRADVDARLGAERRGAGRAQLQRQRLRDRLGAVEPRRQQPPRDLVDGVPVRPPARALGPMGPAGPRCASRGGGPGIPWLPVLPILAAAPAAALLLWGLVRGRPLPALGGAAVLLSLSAFGFGGLLVLEDSKRVDFCGSCHLMAPIVASLEADDGSLASTHLARRPVPPATPRHPPHRRPRLWGPLDAKKARVPHIVHPPPPRS